MIIMGAVYICSVYLCALMILFIRACKSKTLQQIGNNLVAIVALDVIFLVSIPIFLVLAVLIS